MSQICSLTTSQKVSKFLVFCICPEFCTYLNLPVLNSFGSYCKKITIEEQNKDGILDETNDFNEDHVVDLRLNILDKNIRFLEISLF